MEAKWVFLIFGVMGVLAVTAYLTVTIIWWMGPDKEVRDAKKRMEEMEARDTGAVSHRQWRRGVLRPPREPHRPLRAA